MDLLTNILTFVGFIAITFGAAGHISKAIKAREERNRLQLEHHHAVMDALSRLEASIKQSSRLP